MGVINKLYPNLLRVYLAFLIFWSVFGFGFGLLNTAYHFLGLCILLLIFFILGKKEIKWTTMRIAGYVLLVIIFIPINLFSEDNIFEFENLVFYGVVLLALYELINLLESIST